LSLISNDSASGLAGYRKKAVKMARERRQKNKEKVAQMIGIVLLKIE
jgi:hypothetical protein